MVALVAANCDGSFLFLVLESGGQASSSGGSICSYVFVVSFFVSRGSSLSYGQVLSGTIRVAWVAVSLRRVATQVGWLTSRWAGCVPRVSSSAMLCGVGVHPLLTCLLWWAAM